MNIADLTGQAYPAQTERAATFVSRVMEESPLLRALMNFVWRATEHKYRPAAGGQTLNPRGLGGSFTASDLTPGQLQSGMLAIAGFILHYDEAYEKDHELGLGIDMDSWLDQELAERAVDTAEDIETRLLSGDGTNDDIKGLLEILDGETDLPGLGITGVIDGGETQDTDYLDLTDENKFSEFLELFEKWKQELREAGILITNRSMAAKLTTIARKFHQYSWDRDAFGERIEMIDGIPIVRVIDEAMPLADGVGDIILAANREGHWNIGSNSGLAFWDVGELPTEKMSRAVKFEVRAKHEIRTKRAIRRIENIRVQPAAAE